MRFYDASSNLISQDDDGGSGLFSQITYQVPEGQSGTYYISAGAYADRGTGTYTVSASTVEPPPPGFSYENGYGAVDTQRAFENLLGIDIPDADHLGGNLWGLDNVNAPEIWAGVEGDNGFTGVTGEGVVVAVVDTGVDLDHPEFAGRLVNNGRDFSSDGRPDADDGHNHGTHCAGTILAAADGVGITGVAYDARLLPVKVLSSGGSGSTSGVINGINWAAEQGADVISLSLGGGGFSQAMADAVANAASLGAVVVMAAGNSAGPSPIEPAARAVDHGLAIGADDRTFNMAGFSEHAGTAVNSDGRNIDFITAPGVDVYSSVIQGRGRSEANYDVYSGTSMATPHVSGVAALLKSHDPSLTAAQIENLLVNTASNWPVGQDGNANGTAPPNPPQDGGGSGGSTRATNSTTSDSITGTSDDVVKEDYDALINLKKLDSKELSANDLQSGIIVSLSGDRRDRHRTLNGRDSDDRSQTLEIAEVTETFEALPGTNKQYGLLELGDHRKSELKSALSDLLESGQVEYLEMEQTWTVG
jgi:subtilisin family serine protease